MPSVSGFRIEAKRGRGGMGSVYLAQRTDDDQVGAIKMLPEEYVNDHERRLGFSREIESLSRLSHPNIVKILQSGFSEQQSNFGVMGHTPYLTVPTNSSSIKVLKTGKGIEFVCAPHVDSGDTCSADFELDRKPHLMSSLAAVHANRDFPQFWTARSFFKNNGDQMIKRYRVRFRIPNTETRQMELLAHNQVVFSGRESRLEPNGNP